jgi:hypothetical protein
MAQGYYQLLYHVQGQMGKNYVILNCWHFDRQAHMVATSMCMHFCSIIIPLSQKVSDD